MLTRRSSKPLFLLLSWLLLAACAHGGVEHPEGHKSFLWKAQSPTGTVYLLGSIHFARKDLYPLSRPIEQAFKESDVLITEARIDQVNQRDMHQLIFKYALYPPNQRLRDNLSEETYEMTRARLEKYGIPIIQFEPFKPWFLALNLSSLALRDLGFDPDYGIDRYFIEKAAESDKEIDSLETVEFQMELFSQFESEDQEQFLKYTLVNLEALEGLMDDLVRSWSTGDTEGVLAILTQGLDENPEMVPYYEEFIGQRNEAMTERIRGLLAEKRTCFVVVGAGHLVGSDGIVQRLREAGYAVEQL